jgi:hypothetical protein
MNEQPTALRLAHWLDKLDVRSPDRIMHAIQAAAELRRLHAEVESEQRRASEYLQRAVKAETALAAAPAQERLAVEQERERCARIAAAPAQAAQPPADQERPCASCDAPPRSEHSMACTKADQERDAARYRWLRDNIKETPLRPASYGAEQFPDMRLKYVLPDLVSWTPATGQIALDAAIDAAMSPERGQEGQS